MLVHNIEIVAALTCAANLIDRRGLAKRRAYDELTGRFCTVAAINQGAAKVTVGALSAVRDGTASAAREAVASAAREAVAATVGLGGDPSRAIATWSDRPFRRRRTVVRRLREAAEAVAACPSPQLTRPGAHGPG